MSAAPAADGCRTLAAGHSAQAVLYAAEDGSAAVSGNRLSAVPVTPRAMLRTFVVARDAPMFYGATEDGELICVTCHLGNGSTECAAVPAVLLGLAVRCVNAAAHLTVLFTCTAGNVWLVNLETPRTLQKVGTVTEAARVVAAFAAPDVAVAVVAHPTKTLQLVVLSLEPRHQWTWGEPQDSTKLDSPAWATCCAGHLFFGVVTVYVGGSRVVASQIEAVLAGPPKGRTRILMTARRHPVITVAAAESAVLLLLNNQKLIKLTEKGRTTLAPCRALTDTGHTI